jgi:hypothetical protein
MINNHSRRIKDARLPNSTPDTARNYNSEVCQEDDCLSDNRVPSRYLHRKGARYHTRNGRTSANPELHLHELDLLAISARRQNL